MTARIVRLGPARLIQGHCFVIKLPADIPAGDTVEAPRISTVRLFENGQELGPAHALHAEITDQGHGRFSHWGNTIYLSSSDGSLVATNGKTYSLLIEPTRSEAAQTFYEAARDADRPQTPYQRFELAERLFNQLVPGVRVSEYGRSYFLDQEFAAYYEKFSEGNYRAYDRRWTVGQFAAHAVRLNGSFAECGVYRGATAYLMAKVLAKCAAPGRMLHLFDSFAGLSAPIAEDGDYWQGGDMSAGIDAVRLSLANWAERIILHQGWIPGRFDGVADERFAFVHIDVDLYQPTRDSLSFFYERMVAGGILLCDDYGFASCPGARKAMDEFFANRPEAIIHLPTGQGLIICGQS